MGERGDPWLVGGPWEAVTGEARAALEQAVERLAAGGVVELPQLRLVPSPMVARWVYRRWLAAGGGGRLEEVDSAHVGGAGRRSSVAVVHVAGEVDRRHVEALAEGPAARVLIDGGEPHDIPIGAVVGIEQLDALHAVTVDAALATARAALLRACREGRVVRVIGPDRQDAVRLARWAHLAWSPEVPCRVYTPGLSEPGGRDGWRIYEDVDGLSGSELDQLRLELARRDAIRHRPYLPPPGPLVARPEDPRLAEQIGHSQAIVRLLRETLAAAPVGEDVRRATVHITGPTGSGKEEVAKALHALSGRRGPLVSRDLRAVPETLVSAELFGTKKGTFTGAEDKPGLFLQAHGGTLFLDEIANIPLPTQQELLRVLEERLVTRVLDTKSVPVDVRVITATSADLDARVEAGQFSPDLLFRLRPRTLRVPSLAERREDIEELVRHLLPAGARIDEGALLALLRHSWPGNVRELRNELEQAALTAPGGRIRTEHLGVARPPLPVLLVGAPDGVAPARDLAVVTLRPRSGDPDVAAVRSPADPTPLDHLLGRLWPGGLPGLLDAATRGGTATAGPFTVVDDRPHRPEGPPRDPLFVVYGPVRTARDTFAGLATPVSEPAVLVGRGLGDLLGAWAPTPGVPPPPSVDEACLERVRWLRERLGDRPPAPASLDGFHHLSRGHVLVQREGRGLRVTRLPNTRASVSVLLVEEEEDVALAPGAEVLTGQLARVTVSRKDHPSAELWFCAGLDAYAELGVWLRPLPAGITLGPDADEQETRPAAVWRVTPAQRDCLVALAVGFIESGMRSFAASLAFQLPRLAVSPETARVAGFVNVLEASHRLKNYARLLAYAPNAEVLDALAAALARYPAAYVDTLPAQVLQLVRPRMRPEDPA